MKPDVYLLLTLSVPHVLRYGATNGLLGKMNCTERRTHQGQRRVVLWGSADFRGAALSAVSERQGELFPFPTLEITLCFLPRQNTAIAAWKAGSARQKEFLSEGVVTARMG